MDAEEGGSAHLLRELAPRQAAEALAALCGIEPQHFTYRGAAPVPGRHGLGPLAARCRIAQLGARARDLPPDLPPFSAEDVKAYRSAAWLDHLRDYNAGYLAGRPRMLHSPLHHQPVRIIGEVVNDSHQVHIALHGNELFFFLFVGRLPQGIYYPSRDLFLVLRPNWLHQRDAVFRFLRVFLSEPLRFARFIARGMAGQLIPGFVVGDRRPGHYLKESLAYLDAAEAEIVGFQQRGGLLVLIADWCAMDPLAVIPALGQGEVLTLHSATAPLRLLDLGVDQHRVYRTKAHEGPDWLRRRLGIAPNGSAPEAVPRRFRVMLSVDAERGRVLNQVEAFRFVLRRLGAACAARGLDLEVAWDGWTVPRQPNERDLAVMARIEATVAEIIADPAPRIARQVRIHGRSAFAKVAEIAQCDLVLTTQGTGALLPSWLLDRPAIVYHVAAMVPNRSDLSEATVVQLDQRAVIEEARDGPAAHGNRFSLALWGLDDALVRAVGDRLGLQREIAAPPAAAHTTMNAGTE
jgi:hypothetical protein